MKTKKEKQLEASLRKAESRLRIALDRQESAEIDLDVAENDVASAMYELKMLKSGGKK